MKKNLILLILCFAGSALVAQTPVATPVSPVKKKNSAPAEISRTYFCCTSCDYTALNLRSCPVHQTALVKVGDWYCPVDGKSFVAGGKCNKGHANLVRMEMKYKTVTPKPAEMKKAEPVSK